MNILTEYKIQINLNPHNWDNADFPYYWSILGLYESWCIEGSGWSQSIEQAFHDSYDYYKKHLLAK